ncbi:MAG: hypothetical protein ONB05_00705 [candidate division KSB1 bacterium]|nr:hypothetical protein [candidate division KSB1 bacterium]
MAPKLTVEEIIEDLQAIEPIILDYEKKYQLLSPYFFTLYQAGMLEEHKDFLRWAALYQTKLDRENQYLSYR